MANDTIEKGQDKKPIGVNLSAEGRRLLSALKQKHGVSQTGIVEMAIREKAQKDGVA